MPSFSPSPTPSVRPPGASPSAIARFHPFPGSRSDVTAAEMAAEIDRVLARLAAGDFDVVPD